MGTEYEHYILLGKSVSHSSKDYHFEKYVFS